MVVTWGSLPNSGMREEIGEETPLHVGDFIEIQNVVSEVSDIYLPEKQVMDKMLEQIQGNGHTPAFVQVESIEYREYTTAGQYRTRWAYVVNYAFIVQRASPITALQVVAIAIICFTLLGLSFGKYVAIAYFQWRGVSPEELEDYFKATPDPLKDIGLILAIIVVGLIGFAFFWKR